MQKNGKHHVELWAEWALRMHLQTATSINKVATEAQCGKNKKNKKQHKWLTFRGNLTKDGRHSQLPLKKWAKILFLAESHYHIHQMLLLAQNICSHKSLVLIADVNPGCLLAKYLTNHRMNLRETCHWTDFWNHSNSEQTLQIINISKHKRGSNTVNFIDIELKIGAHNWESSTQKTAGDSFNEC